MITGFNTDIEHEGTVYHVQTEDKGLETPLILSLVYVGGAILASKRSPYDDLIAKGFDERELADRLNRQHKLICAAIRAGRIDDLKRMSQRGVQAGTTAKASQGGAAAKKERAATPTAPEKKAQAPAKKESVKKETVEEAEPLELPPPLQMQIVEEAPLQSLKVEAPQQTLKASTRPKDGAAATAPQPSAKPSVVSGEAAAGTPEKQAEVKVKKAAPVQKAARPSVRAILQDVVADFARAEAASDAGLHLSLLDEKEFRGGAAAVLKIRVGRGPGGNEAINGADITVKVLGSTFRPLIFPAKTGADGVATVRTTLPHFKTGRAAILVRAIADGYEAELRRIIQQG